MQFQVPQNIDLEDKIVGPLTLIQFLYLLAGGLIDYLLLIFIGMKVIFWILAVPIGLFALALAFLKIQDQPLSSFVKAGLVYFSRPRMRYWQRKGFIAEAIFAKPKKVAPKIVLPKRKIEKSELEKLAQMLDTRAAPQ